MKTLSFPRLILLLSSLTLLALSGCQSSLLTDLAAESGDRLFSDDFSVPSSNWPVYSSDEGTFAFYNEAYYITVVNPSYQMWALSGHSYSDVQIEADVVWLAGPQLNLYGLVCRGRDGSNFAFFVISSDGYYGIGRVDNGETTLLGQDMMAYSTMIALGGTLNHLRFDCIGSTLAGYVNDQMVAITADSTSQTGDAGLIVGSFEEGGVEVSFDNFVVYKP